MRCSSCEQGSLIEIKMRLNGSELTFRRCGNCETQQWETLEGNISLSRVLELARAG